MATPSPNSPLFELMQNYPRPGRVEWMSVRPVKRQPPQEVAEAYARPGTGLDGDHYAGKPGSKRQVTLLQAEHLTAVASFLGRDTVDPLLLRRNIIVRGLNLLALKDKRFTIGEAEFEYSGECHPCSRMEQNLGPGGYNAMRQHGGILARVVREGRIRVGDQVVVVS